MGQLCDDNCTVTFDKHKIKIFKNNNLLLQGFRSQNGDGLWDLPIPRPPPHSQQEKQSTLHYKQPSPSINIIIKKATTARDLILYYHTICFLPTKSTFLKAIKNNHFIGWPDLTSLSNQNLLMTPATVKGHLHHEQ